MVQFRKKQVVSFELFFVRISVKVNAWYSFNVPWRTMKVHAVGIWKL